MVEIYYGRAGTGKTYTVMQRIYELSQAGKKAILIVPEQLSMTRESEIHRRGIKNVQVLSFSRFANTVFRALGGTAKNNPDSAMSAAAVFCAVDNVYDELGYYKRTAYKTGFISALCEAFSEFDRNRLTRDSIMAIPDRDLHAGIKAKYRDLFLIYEQYKSMWKGEYKDPASDLVVAAGKLETSDIYDDTVFVFDGFYGFTQIQLDLIAQIIQHSPLCMFAFTTDMISDVFTTVTKEVNKLIRLCKKHKVQYSANSVGDMQHRLLSPALKSVERHAFDMSDYKAEVPLDGVYAFAATNINEELGFVAADIKNAVLSGKYNYRDIAVLCPDADSLRYIVQSVFEKHGIPIFVDTSKTLISQPLMAFVTGAFEIAQRGFEPEQVLSFLKTGLAGVSFDDISLVESYLKIWKIRDNGWTAGPWTRNPDGISSFDTEPDAERLERLNKLKEHIRLPLEAFKKATAKRMEGIAFLKAIYQLIGAFGVADNLQQLACDFSKAGQMHLYDEYTRVYDIFIDMLDSVAAVSGSRIFDRRRFYDIICAAATATTVPGRPARTDEVLFAKTGRARAEDKKVVYIPCMTSNVIPAVRKPSPIITDADKRVFERYDLSVSLDMQMSAYREHFDFYSAVCVPSDRLVLSYSMFTPTGDALSPSEYLEAVCMSAGVEYKYRRDLDDDFMLISLAGAAEEAARTGAKELYNAIERVSGISMAPQEEGDTTLSDSVVEGLYTRSLKLSFSGMDEFVQCPFKFFIDKGLRAGVTEPVEFKSNSIGDYMHKGLEVMLSQKYDISTPDKVEEAIDEIADEYYNNKLADCANRSKRFDYFFDEATLMLKKAAENVAKEVRASDFEPSGFETDISKHGDPIVLDSGYTLRLKGSIDRIDKTKDGYVKIIDYKSGEQSFSLKQIYNGLSMQLPVYASAVKNKEPNSKIAAMYYIKIGDSETAKESAKPMSAQEYEQLLESTYKRDGIFYNDGEVIERLDKSGRLFTKLADERLMTDDEMEGFIEFAKNRIKDTGEKITSGCADISPLGASACQYCKYKAICKIEADDKRIRKLDDMPNGFFKKEATGE